MKLFPHTAESTVSKEYLCNPTSSIRSIASTLAPSLVLPTTRNGRPTNVRFSPTRVAPPGSCHCRFSSCWYTRLCRRWQHMRKLNSFFFLIGCFLVGSYALLHGRIGVISGGGKVAWCWWRAAPGPLGMMEGEVARLDHSTPRCGSQVLPWADTYTPINQVQPCRSSEWQKVVHGMNYSGKLHGLSRNCKPNNQNEIEHSYLWETCVAPDGTSEHAQNKSFEIMLSSKNEKYTRINP